MLILALLGLVTSVLGQTYDDNAQSIIAEIKVFMDFRNSWKSEKIPGKIWKFQAKATTWTPGFNENFRGWLMSDIEALMGTVEDTSWWTWLFSVFL